MSVGAPQTIDASVDIGFYASPSQSIQIDLAPASIRKHQRVYVVIELE